MKFTCAYCKKEIEMTAEQEARALEEVRQVFGPIFHDDELVAVCHECYLKTDPKDHPDKLAQAKKDHLSTKKN